MSDTFVASNGMTVERDHNLDVLIDRNTASVSLFMADGTALALREFFRHEEDERLGRWRWPLKPNYIVVSYGPDDVGVFDEEALDEARIYARESVSFAGNFGGAAQAYFAAHPVCVPILLQAQEDGTDEWFTIRTYPGDPGDRAHADASAHLLESQDVAARVIEGDPA